MKRILITGGSGFIGTNLIDYFLRLGWPVCNLDCAPPRNQAHLAYWREGNLLDNKTLRTVFDDFSPEIILHFGARTDLNEKQDLAGYSTNIEGTLNLISQADRSASAERIIFASSQLVCRLGYQPVNEEDYSPTTLYGESKVRMEKIIRSANIKQAWTIVRPTSFWGPWFDIPYRIFFDVIRRGVYIHPAGLVIHKQWGYVENAAYQIHQLITANKRLVDRKTFYLADYVPIDLYDFATAVASAFGSRKVNTVPLQVLKGFAKLGDILQACGWQSPPLTSFRLGNIITHELQNLADLEEITGPLPFDYLSGIKKTTLWMRNHS